MKHNMNLLT